MQRPSTQNETHFLSNKFPWEWYCTITVIVLDGKKVSGYSDRWSEENQEISTFNSSIVEGSIESRDFSVNLFVLVINMVTAIITKGEEKGDLNDNWRSLVQVGQLNWTETPLLRINREKKIENRCENCHVSKRCVQFK